MYHDYCRFVSRYIVYHDYRGNTTVKLVFFAVIQRKRNLQDITNVIFIICNKGKKRHVV